MRELEWIRLDDVEIRHHPKANHLRLPDHNPWKRIELQKATGVSQNTHGVVWVETGWRETLNYLRFRAGSEVYLAVDKDHLISDQIRVGKYTEPLSTISPENFDEKHNSFRTYADLVRFVEDEKNAKRWLLEHHMRLIQMIDESECQLEQLYLNPYDLAWPLTRPTLTKSRRIEDVGGNILLPLEALHEYRHYASALDDPVAYDDKLDSAVWRGANSGPFFEVDTRRPNRRELVARFAESTKHDIGLSYANYKDANDTIPRNKLESWTKGRLGRDAQLRHRYVLVVEGNEGATNLPWVFLSNSVPVMPRPWVETWKLESFAKPYVHFVPVADDFSNLDEVIDWCESNSDACLEISLQSKLFGLQFFDRLRERRLISTVLWSYAEFMRRE